MRNLTNFSLLPGYGDSVEDEFYQCVSEGRRGIDYYFNLYNHERPHQSLNYLTPAEVYFQRSGEGGEKNDAHISLFQNK